MVKSVLISSLAQLTEAVTAHPAVIVRGGGSKPGLRPAAPAAGAPAAAPVELDLRGLSGIVEYEPGEYVFTAWAGTPLVEIEHALAAHGQYLRRPWRRPAPRWAAPLLPGSAAPDASAMAACATS
jgi:glycolate oxidase FAD binding subunit